MTLSSSRSLSPIRTTCGTHRSAVLDQSESLCLWHSASHARLGLRLPFQQKRFSGIFRFFDFNRLLSKLAMNLVVPSPSLICIFLPAFWPSSAQSLVLSAVRLKTCLF